MYSSQMEHDGESPPTEMVGGVYPCRNDGIEWRSVGDEILVLHSLLKQYHILNSVAASIWRLADGEHTVSQIADRVAEEYDHERGEVQRDVVESLQGLEALQLVHFRQERT